MVGVAFFFPKRSRLVPSTKTVKGRRRTKGCPSRICSAATVCLHHSPVWVLDTTPSVTRHGWEGVGCFKRT